MFHFDPWFASVPIVDNSVEVGHCLKIVVKKHMTSSPSIFWIPQWISIMEGITWWWIHRSMVIVFLLWVKIIYQKRCSLIFLLEGMPWIFLVIIIRPDVLISMVTFTQVFYLDHIWSPYFQWHKQGEITQSSQSMCYTYI